MWQFYSETFKMADAVRASCAAPVFKRPRLEFSPCESDALISYESMSSEERFSIDSGLQEDVYDATSSNDCPVGGAAAVPLNPGCSSPSTNGVHLPPLPTLDGVFDQKEPNDFLTENPSNMLAHESFSGSGMASHQPEFDENDVEDQDSTISELSGLSDLSNVSDDWKPNSDESSWVQRQRNCGMDPRMILAEILPKGTFIPHNVNDGLLWRYIINMLNEPKRTKLTHINTLDDATHLLRTCSKVIVLTGAGVSVSCGIPDFRSRNGIYARLSKDYPDLPDPQAMFDITYFRRDPRPFFKFAKEIYPGQFQPSPSHRFIRLLEKQGRLLRNYTQNIDTLEHAAGIHNVITCHGSFATATCTVCRYKVDSSVIKEDIFNQTIPYCPVCPCEVGERGIMKPDIVFFGEGLSDEFHECMNADKQVCDLLIVIGSSLKVRPVAMIPSSIPTNVPQILINREPLKHLTFDIELLGDCDVIIGELCRRLKSEWSIEEDIPCPPLNEIPRPPPPPPFLAVAPSFASEINNNFDFSPPSSSSHNGGAQGSLSQGEESNSCDYHGLSAIKLDDSEDGSDHAQVPSDHAQQVACPDPALLGCPEGTQGDTEEGSRDCNKKLPDHSYFFFPPSRYVFQGAEVDKEDEEDCCSTSTDYSSDSDSPPRPPSDTPLPPHQDSSSPPTEQSKEDSPPDT